jgi:NADH-quinone oxidoreductase subunit J
LVTLALFFFYVFAVITVASALMVIASRNPVHSVLYLILAFVNSSGLFMLAGAEFLALILIVVYVGAVAVLFLFVVMMLDVDFGAMRQGFLQYMPIGAVIGLIILLELLLVAGSFVAAPHLAGTNLVPIVEGVANTRALGNVIYTRYVFIFEAAGGVLLVAMIGAIVLTLQHRVNVKRQDAAKQSRRKRHEGVENVSVKSGQGL